MTAATLAGSLLTGTTSADSAATTVPAPIAMLRSAIQTLVDDGVFTQRGVFWMLPAPPVGELGQAFCAAVIGYLAYP